MSAAADPAARAGLRRLLDAEREAQAAWDAMRDRARAEPALVHANEYDLAWAGLHEARQAADRARREATPDLLDAADGLDAADARVRELEAGRAGILAWLRDQGVMWERDDYTPDPRDLATWIEEGRHVRFIDAAAAGAGGEGE